MLSPASEIILSLALTYLITGVVLARRAMLGLEGRAMCWWEEERANG